MLDYIEIEGLVKSREKESRFIHSLGVVEVSRLLASRFNLDVREAEIDGIYHDAYRYDGGEESIALVENQGFEVFPEERKNPMLLHGALAAINFEKDCGSPVPFSMKLAVRHHTLGHKEMGKLGAVLYIADYTEKGRKHLGDKDRKRIFSRPTLEAMVMEIIDMQRPYMKKEGIKEAEVTTELYSYLEKGMEL